jgi:hypothetical protein
MTTAFTLWSVLPLLNCPISLDGMFPNIDFASPVYGGQVLLNNILCAAFNFRYYDATFTKNYRYIQAVFFEKKWFID